jgi:hypothetical protein
MLFPHLGPSTPTFRCTCCARRHRSSSSTSVRERLASANALAISGKRCEPGFPDAEPFYTFTAPPRIFFGLTILIKDGYGLELSVFLWRNDPVAMARWFSRTQIRKFLNSALLDYHPLSRTHRCIHSLKSLLTQIYPSPRCAKYVWSTLIHAFTMTCPNTSFASAT